MLTSFTGWSSERCPGIGFLSRGDREIGGASPRGSTHEAMLSTHAHNMQTLAHVSTHMHTCLAHICTPTYTHSLSTHVHTGTHMHTLGTHVHTYTTLSTHVCTHMCALGAHVHMRTHDTRIHMCTHAHTHVHTHLLGPGPVHTSPVLPLLCPGSPGLSPGPLSI